MHVNDVVRILFCVSASVHDSDATTSAMQLRAAWAMASWCVRQTRICERIYETDMHNMYMYMYMSCRCVVCDMSVRGSW